MNENKGSKLFKKCLKIYRWLQVVFCILFFLGLCLTFIIEENNFGGTIFKSIGFSALITLLIAIILILFNLLFDFMISLIEQHNAKKEKLDGR